MGHPHGLLLGRVRASHEFGHAQLKVEMWGTSILEILRGMAIWLCLFSFGWNGEGG